MNKRAYIVVMLIALVVLLAFKPLAPKAYTPANEAWNYAESEASVPLREIRYTRPGSGGWGVMVIDQNYNEAHGLGSTPQQALDNALNNLP